VESKEVVSIVLTLNQVGGSWQKDPIIKFLFRYCLEERVLSKQGDDYSKSRKVALPGSRPSSNSII